MQKNSRLQDASLVSLFGKTIGFLAFAWRVRQQTAKSAAKFFAYVLTGK